MREYLNESLVLGQSSSATLVPLTGAVSGATGVAPLGYWFSKDNTADPTSGGNCGNISRNSYSWWRHHTASLGNSSAETGNSFALDIGTYAGLKVGLRRMYNYCSRGSGGSPDLVLIDQVGYETYENALDANIRYQNTKMADMGFDTIKLRGATVIWDELVPDMDEGETPDDATTYEGSAFFINTKFYNLVIDSETDIVTTPFVEPENQTAKTAKVLFMGNTCVSNMRKHGMCYEVNQAITS